MLFSKHSRFDTYIYTDMFTGMRFKKQQGEGVWNFPIFWHLLAPIYQKQTSWKENLVILGRNSDSPASGISSSLPPEKNGVSQSYCFLTFSHPSTIFSPASSLVLCAVTSAFSQLVECGATYRQNCFQYMVSTWSIYQQHYLYKYKNKYSK